MYPHACSWGPLHHRDGAQHGKRRERCRLQSRAWLEGDWLSPRETANIWLRTLRHLGILPLNLAFSFQKCDIGRGGRSVTPCRPRSLGLDWVPWSSWYISVSIYTLSLGFANVRVRLFTGQAVYFPTSDQKFWFHLFFQIHHRLKGETLCSLVITRSNGAMWNLCVSLKFTRWIPIFQCDGIRRWDLWEVIRSLGWSSHE